MGCTVMITDRTNSKSETRKVHRQVNSTFIQTTAAFNNLPHGEANVGYQGRVRYVTGTGTVDASSGSKQVTGASKETKTKFNSEFASGWTITIGCGGATCTGATCASDAACAINGKTTGGKCTSGTCTAETKNITAVNSDT